LTIVITEHVTREIGPIKFATYADFVDPFSTRIRDDWKIEPLTLLACALLGDGERFIDLGANIGAFCIPVAKKRHSPFLAVEALKDNVDLLRIAIRKNCIENATIVNAAIWDSQTTVQVKGHSAYGTVNISGEGIDVTAITGDIIFDEYGFSDARLVKIDIEGAELHALKGMREFLTASIPRYYIFEANGAHAYGGDYMPSDIISVFEKLGLQIFMIVGKKLVPYASSDLQPFGLINYLATTDLPGELNFGFGIGELTDDMKLKGVMRTLTEMKPGYRKFMMKELERTRSAYLRNPRVQRALESST